MSKLQIRNSLLLLLTATIWGFSFVAQSVGLNHIDPFTFTFARSVVAMLALLPVIRIFGRDGALKRIPDPALRRKQARMLLLGGTLCGIAVCIGTNLQQFAMRHTTVGKAGFITALYIVIVPVIGRFIGKKLRALVWVGVFAALVGLYFLCITESFTIGLSDVLLFAGAVVFALHILIIDHFSAHVDGLRMSFIQCGACALASAIPMLLFERPVPADLLAAWLPILYTGALSCGVGFTLQILAQRDMNPTVASLILSLESVMSVLAGWLLLNQRLNARELTGCALMLVAILLSQLPDGFASRRSTEIPRT